MQQQPRFHVAMSRMEQLAIAHAERKEQLEWDTVSSILADPPSGRAQALSAGLQCADFDCEDMRLMYAAVLVAAERGKEAVLRLILRALGQIGHIDPQARAFERNTQWSIESLVSFACSYPNAQQ